MTEPGSPYEREIASLHRELGIPANYAQQHGLPLQPEANQEDLITVAQKIDGAEVVLAPAASKAWHRLKRAAHDDGITLVPISGFRSVMRQAEIIRQRLQRGYAINDILLQIAAPGFSEHHTGFALDMGSSDDPPLEQTFAETRAYQWLNTHAHGHGWRLSYPKTNPHGIIFEPWHWFLES